MTVDLDIAELRSDQLWYVAHPVHPTDEEVERVRSLALGGVYMSDRALRYEVILNNINNAKQWLAWLIREYPSVTFIAPWIATLDGGGDDDLDPEQRERGLRDCCRAIRRCDGVVLVGGRVSDGMRREAENNPNVVDLTHLGRTRPTEDPRMVP